MSDVPMPPSGGQYNFCVEYAAAKIDQIRVATGHTGLCFRCRHGFVVRREHDFDARIVCQQLNQRMPPDVAACSRFVNSSQLTIFELIQLCDPTDILSKQKAGFKQEAI